MKTWKNILATVAVALSLNGAAEKILNTNSAEKKETDGGSKEKIEVKEPTHDPKVPQCGGGGGTGIV